MLVGAVAEVEVVATIGRRPRHERTLRTVAMWIRCCSVTTPNALGRVERNERTGTSEEGRVPCHAGAFVYGVPTAGGAARAKACVNDVMRAAHSAQIGVSKDLTPSWGTARRSSRSNERLCPCEARTQATLGC